MRRRRTGTARRRQPAVISPAPTEAFETIAALATPPGRGAIAIVRASGERAGDIAARVFRSRRPLAPRVATLGRIVDPSGAEIDSGLALFFPAPHSYTGEDMLELHVHGSPVVVRDTLATLLAAGARLAQPGEFTRRAYLNGKLDLSAAEAVADLIDAESRSAARAARARLAGGLVAAVAAQRERLGVILEELAGTLDFPDEVPEPPRDRLSREIAAICASLDELAAGFERGRMVREGVAVAIVGPPNAGKSSLLNALLEEDRALVSEIAGTTRDTIEESFALDGVRVRLVDTAGIRAHADRLEAAGIARSERALDEARIALVVIDGSRPLDEAGHDLLRRTRERPRVVLFNKRDAGARGYDARPSEERDALSVSVLERTDLARVRAALHAAIDLPAEDLERPHLATARQADCVLAALRALRQAGTTLEEGHPVDLVAGDLMDAAAALGELTGAGVSEAVLDRVFARFCIGK
ncbi:MAG: tRNA uridine-5-carboxymethylaminomethyl(34) synthesis GTPase MnmE [Candidatus Eremiobacteraeota bacterium]|nr:tRNA uridine-5-carboxymethylaminomethyl(34) synthesis GTPase MnmE [Candidatus Eremiobacteraeota bacterium]